MPLETGPALSRLRRSLRSLGGQHMLAFVPAITLTAFWLGGEAMLILTALLVPAVLALGRPSEPRAEQNDTVWGGRFGFVGLPEVVATLDTLFHPVRAQGRSGICLIVELDDLSILSNRFGHKAAEDIVLRTAERLRGQLRDSDRIARTEGGQFAITLTPMLRADLETAIQISGRLQQAVAHPVSIDATAVYMTCSIGFCLSGRAPEPSGDTMLEAALCALSDARRAGQGTIRAYSNDLKVQRPQGHDLAEDVALALESGQIVAWFQPQISTDTGRVTGFEALARWVHPANGLIMPDVFLPAIKEAGLLERLGEVMLYQSLTALRSWDKAGVVVPTVGVNFSGDELRNPNLVEKLRWELDRFDLTPDRLCVEILETVVATTGDDILTRNIAALSKLGCGIDLDDFGTGHASISTIRRFAIGRIKIDRSFVARVDEDAEQQRMVSAILTMAERLGLDTLAEGVETLGEHAMLSQLGCGHIQGFGLARPMPFDDTARWIEAHNAKLSQPPTIGRRIG